MKKNLFWGYLATIISASLYGCMALITKNLYAQGVNTLTAVLLRNLLSLPMMGLLAIVFEKKIQVPGKALAAIGVVGLFGSVVTPLLLFASYNYIASGTATVLHFVYPALTVVAGILFLGQRANWKTLLCVVVCMAGIALFYDPGQSMDWRGAGLAIGSGATYAAYILLLSVFRYKEISGFRFGFWISLSNSVVLLLVCLITGQLRLPANWTGWCYGVALALVVNVGAMVLFQQGARAIGSQRAAVLSTLEPVVSVVVGWRAFDETIGYRTIIGAALVLLASILIALFDAKKKTEVN